MIKDLARTDREGRIPTDKQSVEHQNLCKIAKVAKNLRSNSQSKKGSNATANLRLSKFWPGSTSGSGWVNWMPSTRMSPGWHLSSIFALRRPAGPPPRDPCSAPAGEPEPRASAPRAGAPVGAAATRRSGSAAKALLTFCPKKETCRRFLHNKKRMACRSKSGPSRADAFGVGVKQYLFTRVFSSGRLAEAYAKAGVRQDRSGAFRGAVLAPPRVMRRGVQCRPALQRPTAARSRTLLPLQTTNV